MILKQKIKFVENAVIKSRRFAWYPIKVYLLEPTEATYDMDKFKAYGYKIVWLESVNYMKRILDSYGNYYTEMYYEFKVK